MFNDIKLRTEWKFGEDRQYKKKNKENDGKAMRDVIKQTSRFRRTWNKDFDSWLKNRTEKLLQQHY